MVFIRSLVLAAFSLYASVFAQSVALTNSDYSGITVGEAFEVSWTGDGTPVTITLLNGPVDNLQPAGKGYIVRNITTSPYTWIPSLVIASGNYALSICQSGVTDYSPRFTIDAQISHMPPKGPPLILNLTATSPMAISSEGVVFYPTLGGVSIRDKGLNARTSGIGGSGAPYPYITGGYGHANATTVGAVGLGQPTQSALFGDAAMARAVAAWFMGTAVGVVVVVEFL